MANSPEQAPSVEELLGEKFTPKRMASLGAAATSHSTVMGLMDGEEVAAKVFFSKFAHQKAHQEEKLTRHVRKLGYETVDHLNLIGPIPIEGEKKRHAAILISRYVPNLIAAHTLSYAHQPESREGAALREPVMAIADTLSGLHSDMVTHGDAQLRNFAFRGSPDGGLLAPIPMVYDFESGLAHKAKPGIGKQMYEDLVKKDVGTLMLSLGDKHFGGERDREAQELAREVVLAPYLDRLDAPQLGAIALGEVVDFAQTEFDRGRHSSRPSGKTE